MRIPLADTIFWIAVVSCLVAQVAIVRSVLRMRAPMTGSGMTRPRFAAEVAWVVTPAIGLAFVLFMTWRAIHPATAAHAPDSPTLARVNAPASAR